MKERELEKAEERTGEDRQERTARELIELLNELRVILPGVQVLFAFLLMVPFTQRFPDLDDLETGIFFVTLLCTAVATALLIAPSAHHRILWRGGVREQRLVVGNVLAIAGLIQNTIRAQADRVPYFGDLPYAGRLFAFDRITNVETELVVLVTPELVHPLEGKEMTPLPGSDIFEPGDIEFYLRGILESRRTMDYRSTVRTERSVLPRRLQIRKPPASGCRFCR